MSKISLLPLVANPDGTETVIILKDGVSKRASLVAIVSAALAATSTAAIAAVNAAKDAAVAAVTAAKDAAVTTINALVTSAATQAGIATTKAAEAAASAITALGASSIQITTGDDPQEDSFYTADIDTGIRLFRVSSAGVPRDQFGNRYLKEGDVDLNALGSFQQRDDLLDADDVPVRFATVDLDTGLIISGVNEIGDSIGLAATGGAGGTVADLDRIYVDWDPTFSATGVDRRLRVLLPSPVPGSTKWIEHMWYRSTATYAVGTYRRYSTFEATLTNTSALTTTLGIALSQQGYSGPIGPWGENADASGNSYDNGQAVYTVSPFNYAGGGDIHKNNYPLSFRLFVDGEAIDLTSAFKRAAREVRIEYSYKVLRSRNPQLSSSGTGFVHVFETVTLNARDQLKQSAVAKYQEQFTGSPYAPIECIDEWPEYMFRDSRDGNDVGETFTLSGYTSGDNNVPGVSFVRFWNNAGYACEITMGEPATQLAANAPWGAVTPSPFDVFIMKYASGDSNADPFKIYGNIGGPGTFAAYNGTAARQFAGDEHRRTSTIKYFLP